MDEDFKIILKKRASLGYMKFNQVTKELKFSMHSMANN